MDILNVRIYDPTFLTTIHSDLYPAAAIRTAAAILRNDPHYQFIIVAGGTHSLIPSEYRILNDNMNDMDVSRQSLMASLAKEGLKKNMTLQEIAEFSKAIMEDDVVRADHAMHQASKEDTNTAMREVVKNIFQRQQPVAPRPF